MQPRRVKIKVGQLFFRSLKTPELCEHSKSKWYYGGCCLRDTQLSATFRRTENINTKEIEKMILISMQIYLAVTGWTTTFVVLESIQYVALEKSEGTCKNNIYSNLSIFLSLTPGRVTFTQRRGTKTRGDFVASRSAVCCLLEGWAGSSDALHNRKRVRATEKQTNMLSWSVSLWLCVCLAG